MLSKIKSVLIETIIVLIETVHTFLLGLREPSLINYISLFILETSISWRYFPFIRETQVNRIFLLFSLKRSWKRSLLKFPNARYMWYCGILYLTEFIKFHIYGGNTVIIIKCVAIAVEFFVIYLVDVIQSFFFFYFRRR